jgi:molecular chaperone GrpE
MTNDDTTTTDDVHLQDIIDQLQAELASTKAELERLTIENDDLQAKAATAYSESPESLKELAARAQADLQNAKDRMEREARDIRQYALEGTIKKLLPTIDNLARAFSHLPEELAANDWVKGVQAVEKELMSMLKEAGLTTIKSVDETVDTNRHEVLQMGPGAQDVITEVFEQGYELNGKVLRPAKVKVGDGS